jgi:lysophospholipase L1-like esterase
MWRKVRWSVGLATAVCWALPVVANGESIPVTVGPPLASPEVVVSMPNWVNGYGIGFDGEDGVWFNDVEREGGRNVPYLTHYSPSLGAVKKVPLAPEPPGQNGVWGIAPGLHSEELFLEFYENTLSQITTKNKRKAKLLAEPYGDPQDLVVADDGTIWYLSRAHGCELVHITAKGKVLSAVGCGGDAVSLTIGPDGNIWVAAYTGEQVKEVSASTGAVIATYGLRLPVGIATLGNDIYVAETEPGDIAKIAPDGTVTNYVLPAGRKLEWLVAGPDNAVWFKENAGPNGQQGLGRLSPTGELREVPVEAGKITATKDAIYLLGFDGHDSAVMREPLSNFVMPTPSYIALGDSYSSGEGNPPFEPGTDDEQTPDLCHRSEAAYGPQLSSDLGTGPVVFKACSGAVTSDIFGPSALYPTEPAQRDWLSSTTRLVTLTIGGNDAGFVSLLEHCVDFPIKHPAFGCSTNRTLAGETDARLAALGGGPYATSPSDTSIHSILSVIQALHQSAPGAQILIGLYPRPFGEDRSGYAANVRAPSGLACEVGSFAGVGLKVDYKDALWLDGLGKQLNSLISKAARVASHSGIPVTVVKATNFNGHGFCDEHSLWFNPVEIEIHNPGEAGEEVRAKKSSFHPTAVGQFEGYEQAFAGQVK